MTIAPGLPYLKRSVGIPRLVTVISYYVNERDEIKCDGREVSGLEASYKGHIYRVQGTRSLPLQPDGTVSDSATERSRRNYTL